MVVRFAERLAIAALVLLLLPDPSLAQSLPGHFQFTERHVSSDGNVCIYVSDVKIQGDFVLVAPLQRECTTESDEFSADEGYIFPLNAKDQHSRECRIERGENPPMTCNDGEKSMVRGLTSTEPLSVKGTVSRAAKWDGSRLVLDLDDFETRFTMAGGSGKRALKLRKVYHLEFSFPGGQCVLESIKRSRLVNGRNQTLVSVKGLGCSLGTDLTAAGPDAALLRAMARAPGPVCPTRCGDGENLVGGVCVTPVSCPAGQKLSSKGACYEPVPVRQKPAAKPRSSGCRIFNGRQIC